jgi:uncharacterized BrkB/YihY/UPF0761 family membrane protein
MITLIIVLIALLYTLSSFAIQRKMANMKKVYEMQEIIRQKSSIINKMMPLLIILTLFLVIYYWLLPSIFPTHPNVIIDGIIFAYNTFFIIVVFTFGLILSFSVMLIDRNKRKKEQTAQQRFDKKRT